jgi:hypothetical protein
MPVTYYRGIHERRFFDTEEKAHTCDNTDYNNGGTSRRFCCLRSSIPCNGFEALGWEPSRKEAATQYFCSTVVKGGIVVLSIMLIKPTVSEGDVFRQLQRIHVTF